MKEKKMNTENMCIACGMPMEKPEDHAMGDVSKNYCLHCCKENGEMRNYEETLAGMSVFLMTSQGLTEDAARKMAAEGMSRLPAWKVSG